MPARRLLLVREVLLALLLLYEVGVLWVRRRVLLQLVLVLNLVLVRCMLQLLRVLV